ncbi:SGNH/GDSL hydrolase family protein [Paenibacillus kobensis]|nr:SGNH/GDSL hydrolase family protein [Paenibacillus kobensis]
MQPKLQIVKARYMPDGLHPNDVGHQLLAQRIAPFLETLQQISARNNQHR